MIVSDDEFLLAAMYAAAMLGMGNEVLVGDGDRLTRETAMTLVKGAIERGGLPIMFGREWPLVIVQTAPDGFFDGQIEAMEKMLDNDGDEP